MATDTLIHNLFDMLDDWRSLPAYQLERRADIFFALYLKEILKANIEDHPVIDYIIPEFPIRKGNLKVEKDNPRPNLSFKIDYLAVSVSSKTIFLVELKTENDSFSEKQKDMMDEICHWSVSELVENIISIKKASKSKKYNSLIDKLKEMGWIDNTGQIVSMQDYKMKVVYIMPNDKNVTDERLKIITFKEVIESIKSNEDGLTGRFITSLERWQ